MSIHLLPDKHQFLHAVSVLFVPVALEHWVTRHELHEFLFGHSGIESPCLLEVELLACLLNMIKVSKELLKEAGEHYCHVDYSGVHPCLWCGEIHGGYEDEGG